jgi:hypothetical protein
MDPWLERPALWPDVHQRLITYAADALQSQVGDAYFVVMGERVYVERPEAGVYYPDVSIVERREGGSPVRRATTADEPEVLVLEIAERREVFVEIRDAATGGSVITVLEVLSPSNKRPGTGRDLYLQKQRDVLDSRSHLVEIDLLRGGFPTVAAPADRMARWPYRVVVSPATNRRRREVYPIDLHTRLPRVSLPLLDGDTVVLDLQTVFADVYEKGAYARRIDYRVPPDPPLTAEQEAWARDAFSRVARGSA